MKWYKYSLKTYDPKLRSPYQKMDIPYVIYHIEKHDTYQYLGHTYFYNIDFDDTDTFFNDMSLYELRKKSYPSKTVEFLGNDNLVESYVLKNNILLCNIYEIINNKKVSY